MLVTFDSFKLECALKYGNVDSIAQQLHDQVRSSLDNALE